ncbi:hypothetical protein CLU79DRAFT_804333 [Phycomyces nitens]|nr:hypothetical protein CLU79DRAFT_804333 [Phycomyces nitens]
MMQPEIYETLNSILSREEIKILREQLWLRSLKMKSSDQYKMLDVQRCIENDSELTCYCHFAKIQIYCCWSIGEPVCIAVKQEMIAGQSLYPCSDNNLKSKHVEFSTNERKKHNASSTIAIKQQSKNLRSNLSILNQLERKFNLQTKTILAVDFAGKCL